MQEKSLDKTFINPFIKICHLICESVQFAFEISPNDRSKNINLFLKLYQTAYVSTSFSLHWEKITSMFYELEFTEELKSVPKYYRDK